MIGRYLRRPVRRQATKADRGSSSKTRALSLVPLVFYREHQSECSWGVAVGPGVAPEAPVEIAFTAGPVGGEWSPAFDSVPDFLAVQGAWQAVQGGLPVTALVTGAIVAGVAAREDKRGARVRAAAVRQGQERIVTGAATVWTFDGSVLVYEGEQFLRLARR